MNQTVYEGLLRDITDITGTKVTALLQNITKYYELCNGQQDIAVHCSAWIAKSRAKVGDLAIPSEHLRLQHVSDHYIFCYIEGRNERSLGH